MMAAIMFLTCGNCPCNSVVITARVGYQSSNVEVYPMGYHNTINTVALRQQMSMWRIERLMARFFSINRWVGGISKEAEESGEVIKVACCRMGNSPFSTAFSDNVWSNCK